MTSDADASKYCLGLPAAILSSRQAVFRCRLYFQPRRLALSGTLAVPALSQPLAMAVDPVVSSFGLELPSSLAKSHCRPSPGKYNARRTALCPVWLVAHLARMAMDVEPAHPKATARIASA